MSADPFLTCESCGKRFALKPQFAGKKVRCTCGQVMTAPAADADLMPGQEDDLYELAEQPMPAPTLAPHQALEPLPAGGLAIDDNYPCPTCGSPIDIASVICAACGFNLKTGQQTRPLRATPQKASGTAAPAPASSSSNTGASAPMFPTARVREVAPMEQRSQFIIPGIAAVVVLMLVVSVFVYRRFSASSSPAANAKGDDAAVAGLIDRDGSYEIHDWFSQDPDRMTGEWSRKQALAHANDFYTMGAKRVLVFGSRLSLNVAIELPVNETQRKELFDYNRKFALAHGYKPKEDEAQNWILLRLSP